MREDAVGLRRLAPIRVESLPRAVVRSQLIAGARWGARALGIGEGGVLRLPLGIRLGCGHPRLRRHMARLG